MGPSRAARVYQPYRRVRLEKSATQAPTHRKALLTVGTVSSATPVLASALHFTVAKLFVFEVVTDGAGVSASTAAGVREGEGEGEGGGAGAQETRGPES